MLPTDFRGYIEYLDNKGKLYRVKKEVDPKFEIAAGIRKISDTNGPALLFENIKGHPGWRVAGGLYATKELMALALETEPDEEKIFRRYLEFDQKRVKSKRVSTGPVKEIILKGDDVDLTKIPIATYCELDITPYLTAGVEIAKHPVTGIQNASIHRRMLLGKDKTSICASPPMQLGHMIKLAEEQGKGLGIATVIGPHPALTIASQLKPPMGIDEMEIAGALRGEPFEVVTCETIDVEVPADAEMVIEGVVIPGEIVVDGPFGEYPGNYISMRNIIGPTGAPEQDAPVIKVTAITMRKDPIFHALLTGMMMTENHCLKKWGVATVMYRTLTGVVPEIGDIRGINLTVGGGAIGHVVISLHKKMEATPRDIIYTILARSLMVVRVVVVDEDINIYDPEEVEYAIATRVKPDRDIIILPPAAAPLETPGFPPVYTYKWGIDATAPLGKRRQLFDEAVPPGVDKVNYV